jgi:glyoxylase-like metal-dependent hydrolase (beta-lactamase superfamily II)
VRSSVITFPSGEPGKRCVPEAAGVQYDRAVRELQRGLWHWRAPHPEWRPSEPWDRNVSSYAIDDGERLLLFDPIAPPDELETLAAERDAAVVLTCPWHERDMQGLVERHGVPVYAPSPDTAEDLIRMFGLTAEQATGGSPDLVWLRAARSDNWRPYVAGDELPGGIQTFPGHKRNDVVLWIEGHRAVIAGDTLVDFGNDLEINARWLEATGATREQVVEGLRPLLELPVEHVLATHGGPHDRAALERALSVSGLSRSTGEE